MYTLWALECGMWWCLSVLFRLTAHETALLIFAALMVVSFTPDQWTLKNKLSQHSTFIQFKWSPTAWTNKMLVLSSKCAYSIFNHQNNSISLRVNICWNISRKRGQCNTYNSLDTIFSMQCKKSAFYHTVLRPVLHDRRQHSWQHYVVLFRGKIHFGSLLHSKKPSINPWCPVHYRIKCCNLPFRCIYLLSIRLVSYFS